MMNKVCILVLLALIQSHAFVVPPPTPAARPTTTELNLLRKDGRVRTRVRKMRGFVRRRILRLPTLDENGFDPDLQVVMRNETGSVVDHGIPLAPTHEVPSIEEDIVIIAQGETSVDEEASISAVVEEALQEEEESEEEEIVAAEMEETLSKKEDLELTLQVILTKHSDQISNGQQTAAATIEEEEPDIFENAEEAPYFPIDNGLSYAERTAKNLLEARLASNNKPTSSYAERSAKNLLEARLLAMVKKQQKTNTELSAQNVLEARLASPETTVVVEAEEEPVGLSAVEAEALAAVAEAEAALAAFDNVEDPAQEATTPVVAQTEQATVVEAAEKEDTFKEAQVIGAVDNLFAEGKPQLALDMLNEVDVESSGPLYWRYVKVHYELFSRTQDKAMEQALLEQGFDKGMQQALLQKGIQLVDAAPTEFEQDMHTKAMLLKWKAILLGKLGGFQSTKEKMANSFVIKESLEGAQQLLQTLGEEDSSIYQALGEWCFKVAGISFIERQAASVLFGKPPQSSYDEALKFFLQGYEIKPTPALATKVAETYEKMGQKQLSEEWSQKVISMEEALLPLLMP